MAVRVATDLAQLVDPDAPASDPHSPTTVPRSARAEALEVLVDLARFGLEAERCSASLEQFGEHIDERPAGPGDTIVFASREDARRMYRVVVDLRDRLHAMGVFSGLEGRLRAFDLALADEFREADADVRSIAEEFGEYLNELETEIEDYLDGHAIQEALEEQAGEPARPWEDVKRDLGL